MLLALDVGNTHIVIGFIREGKILNIVRVRTNAGETLSYGELAKRLGSSARAVGAAVGRNPVSILIPCHRVLGAKGELTGYAGGLERKKALLVLEKRK